MPPVARAAMAVVGVGLLAVGGVALTALAGGHSSGWKPWLVAVAATGLGLDLVVGAWQGRWPVAALLWLAA